MGVDVVGHYRDLITELKEIICVAFDQDEFSEFMYTKIDYFSFDYAGETSGAYSVRVFNTIQAINRRGETALVLRFGEALCLARPNHKSLHGVVARLRTATGSPPTALSAAGPVPLPPEIVASLALANRPRDLVIDLRPKLRIGPCGPYDIPSQFHLSPHEGQRLAAILALEAEPNTEYLRWLAERVVVENPLVGYTAAQALTTAALHAATGAESAAVRAALKTAADLLDNLLEDEDQETVGFDVSARKRQIQSAMSLLELQPKKITPNGLENDVREFLACAVKAFDQPGLDKMCQTRLNAPLKMFANQADPIELNIVEIVILARGKGWLPDFVRAAVAERPNDATLKGIAQRNGLN